MSLREISSPQLETSQKLFQSTAVSALVGKEMEFVIKYETKLNISWKEKVYVLCWKGESNMQSENTALARSIKGGKSVLEND